MNALKAPFKQLVERRLWPLAVLLVAALAAIPVVLSDDGEAAAPATGTTTTTAAAGAGQVDPLVKLSDPVEVDRRRKVLGKRKDPFRPAHRAKAKPTATAAPADASPGSSGATAGSTGSSPDTGGSGAGSGSGSTGGYYVAPAPTTTTPTRRFTVYAPVVAFGEASSGLARKRVKRLAGLPAGDDPAVIYIGLMGDHRTAVFVVDRAFSVQGDGDCRPRVSNCQTVALKPGETVFLTRADGRQYELDMVRVDRGHTTSSAVAAAFRDAEARGGRDLLRSRLSQVGRYRYSPSSGALKLLSKSAWRAQTAR